MIFFIIAIGIIFIVVGYHYGMTMYKKKLEKKYSEYLWNCKLEGDIWNETHRPFTYEEWLKEGCPEEGRGVKFDEKQETF